MSIENAFGRLLANDTNPATTAAAEVNPGKSDERLFINRSRSVTYDNTTIGGDRGIRAYIRLLTNDVTKVLDRDLGQDGLHKSYLSQTGKIEDLINGDQAKYQGYADFLLTNVSCAMDEKIQVTPVFGDAEVVYYFGRNPISFNFSGILIDSPDNNWFTQWIELYTGYTRGSQLARNYELLKIVLPNMTIVGTMNNFSWQQTSTNDVQIPFNFQFLAKRVEPNAAIMPSGDFSPEVALLTFNDANMPILTQSTINEIKASEAANTPAWISGVTSTMDGWVSTANNISANLNGVRTAMFSKVFGVLSSLTKLVKSVSGSLLRLTKAFTNPVKNILRDITSISNQVTGLLGSVNAGIDGLSMEVKSVVDTFNTTISSLQKTSGALASFPNTLGDSLKGLVNSGRLSNSPAFLGVGSRSGVAASVSIGSISGKPVSPVLTFKPIIGTNSDGSPIYGATSISSPLAPVRLSKLALLNSGVKRTPAMGAFI